MTSFSSGLELSDASQIRSQHQSLEKAISLTVHDPGSALARHFNIATKSVKRETALSIQNGHQADDIPITRLSAPHLVMTRKE